MDLLLNQLADKLGIATKFSDAGMNKKDYFIDESVIKFFANRLGFKAGNLQEIAKSLDDFDKRRWQKTLESIYVINQHDIKIDVVIPSSYLGEKFTLHVRNKQNHKSKDLKFETINTGEIRQIGRTVYTKLEFKIETPLEVGYYDLTLKHGSRNAKSILAVAPDKCYNLDVFDEGKLWGYAIQLYSIRSERNWGVGDFTDLAKIVKICANSGADIIGLNPLNVLMHDYPEEASPYMSISRLFLNPIYIDVEAVPEYKSTFKKNFNSQLDMVKSEEYISYSIIYNMKIDVLKKCYEEFKKSKDKKRLEAYEEFIKTNEQELNKLAIFQCLYSEKTNVSWGGWKSWEEEYHNSNSLAVKRYAKENEDQINFFKFMQFEADRQFNNAYSYVKKHKLKIGFYRDLAVGVGQDSAEVWSDQDLFIKDAGAGAPPDYFFPQGQKWGLGAFNPYVLRERAYEPFIKVLRANMKNSGALRVDHVMSLMRLYVIPESKEIGTYILYNFREMLDIVAIESQLQKCVIVGESIGNVPEGFLDKLYDKNIKGLSVLWAERWEEGWGYFKAPNEYPRNAFVSVGTHDMPPLRSWWFGNDIYTKREIGLIKSDEEMTEEYKRREVDRWKLLSSLDSNNVWPRDNMRKSNYSYGEGYPEGIEEAVNRFVARSNSIVFLAELENILHVDKMQNLPGVDRDKHPNWRHKLPVSLEKLEEDIAYIRNINAIRMER